MRNNRNGGDAATKLLASLARWSPDLPQHGNAELRQVCHQPRRGTYAYLHTLYPALSDDDINDIETIVERPLPPKLRAFYAATNGARLFEGYVGASGLVRNFPRDPTVANPICIEQDNLAFRHVRQDWHHRGYFRFGGVSILRQDELICGPDDSVVILNGDTGQPLRRFSDVFDCLVGIASEMGPFWTDNGTFNGDWKVLDRLLLTQAGTA